jgi:isocitrate dehydrogenase
MCSHEATSHSVTVIEGDGVGPEVVGAALMLIHATGVSLECEFAEAGGRAFERGVVSGVPEETLDSIDQTRVVLKGPLATPIGEGGKSANVTLRKMFETFANIRPARELPGIPSPYAGRGIDLVIVRENVEDLYAGIEHMQTPNVAQCLKLVSRLGSRRIAHAGLALAQAEGRSRVTVATKANIMKVTEGMFKRECELAAREYPQLKADHMLIDNCAHQLVMNPEQFDVIVTTNMNGDILSDLASGLVGGLGFAPSANLGYDVAMFEAVHGTAPDIAGQGKANPTAMILSAVMLLRHLSEFTAAEQLEQALFVTLEQGIRTADVPGPSVVGTQAFAEAVAANIGMGSSLPTRTHQDLKMRHIHGEDVDLTPGSRAKVGVDIFVETHEPPNRVADRLQASCSASPFKLKMISNRGTQVWPEPGTLPTCVDHYRCRFVFDGSAPWSDSAVIDLLARVGSVYRWMHVEKLEEHDGAASFTRAQGQN